MFRFEQPWFALLLLLLAAGLVWAWRLPPPTLLVSDLTPFRRAFAGRRRRLPSWRLPLLLTAAGLSLCIVALMRPQAGTEQTIRHALGVDIMLVLDVSGSMQLVDVPEDYANLEQVARAVQSGVLKDRISVAKDELKRFVEKRPDDRIGLIAFSRLPYMVCPPTLDHDFLTDMLANLQAGMLPDGTNLAGPLASATHRLKDSPAKRRVVVLFTDGVNNIQDKVSPVQAAELADKFKVTIHTVGIGSPRAVMFVRGLNGGLQVRGGDEAPLDKKLLEDIAKKSGGRFFAARDSRGFSQVMDEIDRLEKVQIEGTQYREYHELFSAWLWAGLLLILAAGLLEKTFCQTLP